MKVIEGGMADCGVAEFVEACIALWPGQELILAVDDPAELADLEDAFLALGFRIRAVDLDLPAAA